MTWKLLFFSVSTSKQGFSKAINFFVARCQDLQQLFPEFSCHLGAHVSCSKIVKGKKSYSVSEKQTWVNSYKILDFEAHRRQYVNSF